MDSCSSAIGVPRIYLRSLMSACVPFSRKHAIVQAAANRDSASLAFPLRTITGRLRTKHKKAGTFLSRLFFHRMAD